ncbi:hypothetical protein EDD85DRAFT_864910 [Armillaria nabsnona]|nr:hypothetical protein EDD85DRAFT_864910 [Armillaria nabsnona]
MQTQAQSTKSLQSSTVSLLPKGLPENTPVSIRPCRCNQNYPNGCEWHIFHPGRQILAVHRKKTCNEPVQPQYSPPPNSPLTEGQLNSFGFGYHADATFTLKQNFSKQKDFDPWAQVHGERIQCLGCNADVNLGNWIEHRGTCRDIEMRVADVIAYAWEKEAKEGAFASRASGIFSLVRWLVVPHKALTHGIIESTRWRPSQARLRKRDDILYNLRA